MKEDYDAIIVGSGISGSVIARHLAETLGKKVIILERRSHIAGNLYDYTDKSNIRIQKYGPHVFHTSSQKLINYLTKYGTWFPYHLDIKISINDKIVPNTPNFKTIDTFFPECAEDMKNRLHTIYPNRGSISFAELMNASDSLIKRFADFLYENDFKPYTEKQWSGFDKKLDRAVFERIPVHLDYSDSYWTDRYQILPTDGYTAYISHLLDHPNITIKLNTNACDIIKFIPDKKELLINGKKSDKLVIWTGSIDELVGYKYGLLPYRSLHFEYISKNQDSYQDAAVIAYPLAKGYTRITEYKKLPIQDVNGTTTIALEYPENYLGLNINEPYYPIPSLETEQLYQKYLRELEGISSLILVGRLAEYKYYNMDQALERALSVCEKLNSYFQ